MLAVDIKKSTHSLWYIERTFTASLASLMASGFMGVPIAFEAIIPRNHVLLAPRNNGTSSAKAVVAG